MRKTKNIFGEIDLVTIGLYVLLVLFGWINIYSSNYNPESLSSIFDLSTQHGKQLLFIAISFISGFLILIIDWHFFENISMPLYWSIIFLLIIVLFIADEAGGASSWIPIGNYKIQPSEFAKFATALALAKMFSQDKSNSYSFNIQIKNYLIVVIPAILTLLQNDLGTSLVFSAFLIVFYREGLSGNILIAIIATILIAFASLIFNPILLSIILTSGIILFYLYSSKRNKNLKIVLLSIFSVNSIIHIVNFLMSQILLPHQVKRINIFLGKEFEPLGAGYNLLQSKIAIGSGGFLGKGYLNGTQTRFDFVPEQSTDFIFCTIGEEWGFLGSIIFLTIFAIFLIRIILLCEKQKSRFCRVYGYSLAGILFIHLLINLGMTIGLAPVIGIPLPFISYGGSSLVSFTILLFIFLNLNSYRMDILR